MYTPTDSPFEKFRTTKLKGVAMSPDVLELVAMAYESGFIDGMQKQMQSSVDRAVNRMAEKACSIENDHRGLIDIGRIFTPEKSAPKTGDKT